MRIASRTGPYFLRTRLPMHLLGIVVRSSKRCYLALQLSFSFASSLSLSGHKKLTSIEYVSDFKHRENLKCLSWIKEERI